MNKRSIGAEGEQRAAEYLEKHGMQIKERNYRSRQGEIDIIGIHNGYLVFVEVKYRENREKGYAAEAVDYRKQCRICRVADSYRFVHKLGSRVGIRYDVVAIQGEQIQWIQNAFPHIETGRAQRWK
ncbi:MAG: YraN family protein [Acetatifactor sp.]